MNERYDWESNPDFRRLKDYFDLTEGFELAVVLAPDEWAISNLRERVFSDLSKNEFHRIAVSVGAPAGTLSEELLEVPKHSKSLKLIWIDSNPSTSTTFGNRERSWERALGRLNRYRNTLTEEFSCHIVIGIPKRYAAIFRTAAPDIWSIRSATFDIDPGFESNVSGAIENSSPSPLNRISNLDKLGVYRSKRISRENLLQELEARLRLGNPVGKSNLVSIHGMAGVGKTQLALAYASRFSKRYDLVWWIRADSDASIRSDFIDLAYSLGILQPGMEASDDPELIYHVLNEVSRRSNWLLIFDDAINTESIQKYLPQSRGDILVTFRSSIQNSNWTSFAVTSMTASESRNLILENSGQRDPEPADELAKKLGYLPLAMNLASAFCADSSMPLANYILLLDHVSMNLSDDAISLDNAKIVLQLSFERAFKENKHTRAILGILSFGAPDDFPLEIIDPVLGKTESRSGVTTLERLSLVSLRQQDDRSVYRQIISTHPLVLQTMRAELDADESTIFANAILVALNGACPDNTAAVESRQVYDYLLPHILAFSTQAQGIRFDVAEFSKLVDKMRAYLINHNDFQSAERLMRAVIALEDASIGSDQRYLANSLGNLAMLLQHTNRFEEAEQLMHKSLVISEKYYGNDHPQVAVSLYNLAMLLQDTNRFGEAEPLMRKALAIFEKSYGSDHPQVAISLNNLAMLLRDTNRFEEAEQLMRRALEVKEESYGSEHPNVADQLFLIAELLKATNRNTEAEVYMRRALDIDKNSFGMDHPRVAIRLNGLASVLRELNKLEEATLLMRKALEIDENSFGRDSPQVAVRLNNLAMLLKATNQLAEAEPLMRRALEVAEQSFGNDHPQIAIRRTNLAILLMEMNRLDESEILMRQTFEVLHGFRTRTGQQHPNLDAAISVYLLLLQKMDLTDAQIKKHMEDVSRDFVN